MYDVQTFWTFCLQSKGPEFDASVESVQDLTVWSVHVLPVYVFLPQSHNIPNTVPNITSDNIVY